MTEAYVNAKIAQIDNAVSCQELQLIIEQSKTMIEQLIAQAIAKQAALAPLMIPPGATPVSIVTWITTFITVYVVPDTLIAEQQIALAQALAQLTSAAATRAQHLNCTFTI